MNNLRADEHNAALQALGFVNSDRPRLQVNIAVGSISNSLTSLLYNIHMPTPALPLTTEKIVRYRGSAEDRQKKRAPKIKIRMEKGWELARRAAQILRAQYNVKRVVVFGSLLRENCFTEWSDIDIAAWGISPEQTLRAIGSILDLDSTFEINLVDVSACPPDLLKTIEKEGQDV